MKKVTLLLMTLVAVTSMATGQVDVSAVNKPIELLNEANTDIENGDYKDNRKLLDRFNHFKQILKDTEPLYLKVNDEKKEKSRWICIF